LSQRRDAQSRQRGLFGRFEDGRAAGGEGRAPLPGLHEQREVPGNDLAHDPDRFVARVAEIVAVNGNSLALDLIGPALMVIGTSMVRESRYGLPLSRDSRAASSSSFRSMRSANLLSNLPRSEAFIFGQGPSSKALRAALTARSTSALSP